MDMITIDVTDVPDPHIRDEVVVIGRSEGQVITALDIAAQGRLDLLSQYEIVTRLNPLIRKIYF